MIWQRRRRNQPVDEGAFQKCGQYYGTSKEKGTLKRNTTNVFRNTTSVGSRNLSVVKDNYTEKLYQNILQYYKQINKRASEIM